ncbi:MAG: D-alanyl-D-alanine carboxypeptidase/D-alanyl-D-alanine-endopeptidase [Prolixibacteraceae bacterium]|nr:D-alanyl-D-alanine carboxypeptidase/D-alanyl-D-alanine-endopeptidase [Prolixibacteraceae bacterium]
MNLYHFKSKILLSVLLIACASALFAQPNISGVQQKVRSWQTIPELATASVGLSVTDNLTGEELIRSIPMQSLVPASILKTVTTATALEVFGPDFRFKTALSYSGIVRNDTLWGDLQVIGGGDPTLGSEYFPESKSFQEEWIKALHDKSIKVISGNLVLDATIYESQMIPGSWVWEDLGNYYGAGASGLTIYDNLYEIHLKSPEMASQPTQLLRVVPEIPGLELQNEVRSSDVNSDQAYIFGNPEDSHRVVRGTIPKGKSDFVVRASMPNPTALLANEFKTKLAANSIILKGSVKFEKSGTNSSTLAETLSPPLRDIIRVTNYESVNLFAEHFLKHLAFQKTGMGTTKEGCKFVVQFWKDKGLDMTGFFMNDGSGLSRFNAVTASQMVNILSYMKTKSAYAEDFYQSLATVGSGTLTVFKNENFPNQCLHAKSGSMTRVRCYSGYLTSLSGRQLCFTIMLNNFACSQTEAIRKVEELLVEFRKL